jgi:hypothetical protein
VPRGVWKRAEAINFDADSPPGTKNSSFLRAPGSRRPVGAIFRRFLSIVGFFAKWKIVPKYYACQQKQGFGTSRCESSRSRVATSKNFENRPEKPPKILENRLSGAPGRPSRSTFVARSASVERLGPSGGDSSASVERLGATRGDSKRLGERLEARSRSKWAGRGESGRSGRAGCPGVPRVLIG